MTSSSNAWDNYESNLKNFDVADILLYGFSIGLILAYYHFNLVHKGKERLLNPKIEDYSVLISGL